MTTWMSTTTVDVYRDADITDTDVFGDETDTSETIPIIYDVPASVTQMKESRGNPSDLNRDNVRLFAVRVAQRWGIAEGDRLKDRGTGAWYQVQNVLVPQSFVGVPSCRLVCRRAGTSA